MCVCVCVCGVLFESCLEAVLGIGGLEMEVILGGGDRLDKIVNFFGREL